MDSGFFDTNMHKLRIKQPDVHQELQNYTDFSKSDRHFIQNVEGVDYLACTQKNGKSIQYTSMIDPRGEAQSRAEELDYSKNRTSVIQVGVGLGYEILEICSRLNTNSKLFACEEDPYLLAEILRRHDLSEYIEDDKLVFVVGGIDTLSLIAQIRKIAFVSFPNMTSKKQPVTFPLFDIDYIRFANTVLRIFDDQKNFIKFGIGNNVDDTLVGLNNYLKNNEYVLEHMGIKEFKETAQGRYTNKPAVIVASGPSLNKNVALLKDMQDQALILSCDGSMDLLKTHGVVPDAVGSVERIKYTYDCFYRGKEFSKETLLVAPTVLYPGVFDMFSKGIAFPKSDLATPEWVNSFSFDKKGTMPCGPSVSHMLFNFAIQAGCDPIILIGQDLCYSSEGYSHNVAAEGVQEKLEIQSEYKYYVTGYSGEKLPTTYVWQKFLRAYEHMLEDCDRTVIDATEGGARIEGTEIMTLQQVIDTYCDGGETVCALNQLYDEWTCDTALYEQSIVHSVTCVEGKIDEFIEFLREAEDAVDMIEEAKDIVTEKIETQKQLDFIYDTIDYAGKDFVKKIQNNGFTAVLFRYHLQVAVYSLSHVTGGSFTEENIKENIIILEKLYDIIVHYIKKTLRVLLENYDTYYSRAEEMYPENVSEKRSYTEVAETVFSSEFKLPFPVFYGNGGVTLDEKKAKENSGEQV
jgi:hypothetical protein